MTSDFTELLLVPRNDDTVTAIDGYLCLFHDARALLADLPPRVVGGYAVHDLGPDPNEQALSLVTALLDRSGLATTFGIMIDASADDWFGAGKYRLPVSERRFGRARLIDYWLGLLAQFDVVMLEDPLAETDIDSWSVLHDTRPPRCRLLGDNFTSTWPAQLAAKSCHLDGVLLKPNQNGSMSGTYRFASLTRELGLSLIASARSVETDTPLASHAVDHHRAALTYSPQHRRHHHRPPR
ncbi:hypothetical protein AB0O76_28245 [Streptomyces sp. NPDC086554]|uniref:hypothetical protein n=1 Tax=Streptomyces sp. NPDC086554 TaxID=3154864 RepID=UPI003445B0BC